MSVKPVKNNNKISVKEAVVAIGEVLKERAEDIANDLEWVNGITITEKISPLETVCFEVKKEYTTTFKEEEENGYKSDK